MGCFFGLLTVTAGITQGRIEAQWAQIGCWETHKTFSLSWPIRNKQITVLVHSHSWFRYIAVPYTQQAQLLEANVL